MNEHPETGHPIKTTASKPITVSIEKDTLITGLLAIQFLLLLVFGWQLILVKRQVNGGAAIAMNNKTVPTVVDSAQAMDGNGGAQPIVNISERDDDHVRGNANAPVTIIEYSDFECPFCERAYPTIEQVRTTYGDDVKIIYRHFPLSFHPQAQKAAEASECAADQGKFWEYHDIMFQNQGLLQGGVTQLKQWASDLKLNRSTFDTCLDSGAKMQKVQNDLAEGTRYGVSGTPAFFVNGQSLVGAQPFSAFQAAIDRALNGDVVADAGAQAAAVDPKVAIQLTADDHVRGNANAPITIVEYSDFECPFCSRAHPTVEQIRSTYGNDVKIVYRHFPLSFHPQAQKAAEASECAADQGKFWEFHDKVFENQTLLSGGGVAQLKAWAGELKLNQSKFDTCLDSGSKAQMVQADLAQGTQLGVTGTPAFFVNGQSLVGAQPFSIFQQVIDAELAAR